MSAINQPLSETQETDALGARDVRNERPAKLAKISAAPKLTGPSLSSLFYNCGPLIYNSRPECSYVPYTGMFQVFLDSMWLEICCGRRAQTLRGRMFYIELQIFLSTLIIHRILSIGHALHTLTDSEKKLRFQLNELILDDVTIPGPLIAGFEALSATQHPHHNYVYFPTLPSIRYKHKSGSLYLKDFIRLPCFPALWRMMHQRSLDRTRVINFNSATAQGALTDIPADSVHSLAPRCPFISHRNDQELTPVHHTSARRGYDFTPESYPDEPPASIAGWIHFKGFARHHSRLRHSWEIFSKHFGNHTSLGSISLEASPASIVNVTFDGEPDNITQWSLEVSSMLPLEPPGLHIAMAFAPHATFQANTITGLDTDNDGIPTLTGEGWEYPEIYSISHANFITNIQTFISRSFIDGPQ